jgi:hypothetical protein
MRVGAPLTGEMAAAAAPAGRGQGGGGGGGGGGFNRGTPSYLAVPGDYTARLTIAPASGASTVLSRKFTLLPDPQQQMSQAQLVALDAFRLDVVRFQRSVTEVQNAADSTIKRFGDVRKAALADSSKLTPALRAQLTAVEKVLAGFAREVGATAVARTAGLVRAPGQPAENEMEEENRGASGAPDMSFSARSGSLGSVINAQFPVASAQRSLLGDLRKELAAESAKVGTVKRTSLPALEAALAAAGIKLPYRAIGGHGGRRHGARLRRWRCPVFVALACSGVPER